MGGNKKGAGGKRRNHAVEFGQDKERLSDELAARLS
jgi:hypothetical protein